MTENPTTATSLAVGQTPLAVGQTPLAVGQTPLAVGQTPLAASLCMGANLLFLLASPIAFFASTFKSPPGKNPFDDSNPYYGFVFFCSFSVASFSIIAFGAASTTFYRLVNSPISLGQETARYINLRNSFIIVTILAIILSSIDVCLSFLWGSGIEHFSGFAIPCFLAILATLAHVAVALSISIEFVTEKHAFVRSTVSENALDEGVLRL